MIDLPLVSLRHYRKAFGLTANDVAKRSGLGIQTVYRVEQGKTDKVKSVSKYMRAVGLKMTIGISPDAKDLTNKKAESQEGWDEIKY